MPFNKIFQKEPCAGRGRIPQRYSRGIQIRTHVGHDAHMQFLVHVVRQDSPGALQATAFSQCKACRSLTVSILHEKV